MLKSMNKMNDQNLPSHVMADLNAGFVMTDLDDGFQRCLKSSETVFIYRCDVNDEVHEETIDTDKIDHDEAICGFYDSVDEVRELYGDSALMIIAECYFENNCPAQLPTS